MLNKRHLLQAATATALLLSLAACGGGSSGTASTAADNTGATQAPATDSFLSRVAALIGTTSDTAEPQDIGSVQATTPDSTEPMPVS